MAIDKELIDKLLGDYKSPEDLISGKGLLKELTRALVEPAISAELTHHLGYEKHDPGGRGSGNSRNGATKKTIKGEFREIEIKVPCDRSGEFEPQLVAKRQTGPTIRFCRCTRGGGNDDAGNPGPPPERVWSGGEPDVDL